jgi:hypothetical protein
VADSTDEVVGSTNGVVDSCRKHVLSGQATKVNLLFFLPSIPSFQLEKPFVKKDCSWLRTMPDLGLHHS